MWVATLIVLALLAVSFGFQALWTCQLARLYQQGNFPHLTVEPPPKVAVVMTLARRRSIFGSNLAQSDKNRNYSNYEIRIVVDHKDDPACRL